QGVHGIGDAAAAQFDVAGLEEGVAAKGGLQHAPAVPRRGQAPAGLEGRDGGRDEDDPVEAGGLGRAYRRDQVPVVDGVETAAEQAEPHGSGPDYSPPGGLLAKALRAVV